MNDEKYKQNLYAVTPGRRRDKSKGKQTEIRLLWEQVKHSGDNPILPFPRNPSSAQLSPPFQNTQNTPHLPSARNGLRRVQATITERFWNQKPSTQSRALPAKEDACFKNHITIFQTIFVRKVSTICLTSLQWGQLRRPWRVCSKLPSLSNFHIS